MVEDLEDKENKESEVEEEISEEPAPEPMDNFANTSYKTPSSKKKIILWVIVGLIILAVGYFIISLTKGAKKEEAQTPSSEVSSSTPTPTSTPEAFVRSEWSLEILNGTEVSGAAKKLADKLEGLGYKIVKTGNADKTDYKNNQLYVSADMSAKGEMLLEDLNKEINIASISGELKDSSASARVIIGKE